MQYLVDILGAIGDGSWHVKEEFYTLIVLSAGKKDPYLSKPKNIEKEFNRFIQYGLVRKTKSDNFKVKNTEIKIKGHACYQLTDRGFKALDYYRNAKGGKDLEDGVINDDAFNKQFKQLKNKGDLKNG